MEVFHGNPRWAGPRAGINTAESQKAVSPRAVRWQQQRVRCAGSQGRQAAALPFRRGGSSTSPCALPPPPPRQPHRLSPTGSAASLSCPPEIPMVPAYHECPLAKPGTGHRLQPEAGFWGHVLSLGCPEKSRPGRAPRGPSLQPNPQPWGSVGSWLLEVPGEELSHPPGPARGRSPKCHGPPGARPR